MAQTSLFLQAVKTCLKNKSLTYADVARHLKLSEASVKRIFSEENISLQRLDQICQLMSMELCDLAKIAEQKQHEIQELTEEQEAEFVKQPKLLFVAYMLLNDMDFESIKTHYNIDEHEGIQLLAHLDRIKFIDLLPGNRVKLLTSRNFRWRKNGAIEKLFNEHIRKEFFQSRFSKSDECMKFGSAMVSRSTILLMHQKIEKLVGEFNELAIQDASLPYEERRGCSIVGAIRPWEFSLFAQYRKK
ncbi:helix-turn-helix domain-containing protein [Aliikangiella coralliicola]|uniref:Helix-turn-helix transcriptional regulator n=1 Tax=Aliikangiella coralliicola TaxID=2592383 RepID=A0A545UF79_9GAMM|nr:helix-turn-helix transcriptional regulator [Aliikangiella coralliicola]TQV88132.1 helix-turn-helix transcriptional regulator [Aliikangiella coralliicola]